MRHARVLVTIAVALAACEPEFRPEGSLSVQGQPFAPIKCNVQMEATGVTLRDAAENHLDIAMPPTRLEAFAEISGAARATITRAGGAPVELGECGTLRLEGEGYHGNGTRAASGTAALQCSGASGTLSFTGCH